MSKRKREKESMRERQREKGEGEREREREREIERERIKKGEILWENPPGEINKEKNPGSIFFDISE